VEKVAKGSKATPQFLRSPSLNYHTVQKDGPSLDLNVRCITVLFFSYFPNEVVVVRAINDQE
jgi:hypothetical protein